MKGGILFNLCTGVFPPLRIVPSPFKALNKLIWMDEWVGGWVDNLMIIILPQLNFLAVLKCYKIVVP
jgi:hypothetical protein